MLMFNHSGALGDILYSLYLCKQIIQQIGEKKFNFHMKISNEGEISVERKYFSRKDAQFIKPLLESQDYINEVMISEDIPQNCMDLDSMRKMKLNLMGGDIRSYWYNLYGKHLPREFWKPNITVWPNYKFKDKILFSYTQRYVNIMLNYNVIKDFADKMVFVGLERQYNLFKSKFFDMQYLNIKDLLDAAQYIAGAKGFIGNESGLFALAQCLKVPRILLSPQLVKMNGKVFQGPFNVNPIGGWNEVASTTEKFLYSVKELIKLNENSSIINSI